MGSTAPTSLPDSISMSEGISSPDNFSRLLRKLAKGDLLVESFSARLQCYFSYRRDLEVHALDRKHTIHIPRTMSSLSISLFPRCLLAIVCRG
jgi:hypothetical protein